MTQRNLRGAYYCPTHDYKEDWDWLAAWQPNVIRLMLEGKPEDPNSFDVHQVKRVHDTCPDATILLRCWDVDDRNFAAHDEMVKDPVGEAERQVNWWSKVFDNAVAVGVPREKLMAGLNNETGPDKDGSLYPYTEHALTIATPKGIRLGVLVFSNGRPSLDGESQYSTSYFAKLDNLIIANNGARLLHEYMQPEGMYAVWIDEEGKERKDWTYLMGRNTRWPVNPNVNVIIGEWGLNGIIYNRHPDPKYGDSGWTNFKEWPPSRYADEYVECIRQASPNVIAICPFIEDWKDHKWQSFDLRGAYTEFLARKDKCVRDDAPVTINLPSIQNDTPAQPAPTGPTATPNTPAGANVRSGPNTSFPVLGAVPTGQPMPVTGVTINGSGAWYQVQSSYGAGWVSFMVVSVANIKGAPSLNVPDQPPAEPAPSQPSDPAGDNWSRIRTFLHQWEGGLQKLQWDAGNWTGCAVGAGELKGTNFGISACGYPNLDIEHLTQEQADNIFYNDMYLALGIDKQPWPLNLLMMNAAVNFPKTNATVWLQQSGGDPMLFYALMLRGYRHSDAWPQAGNAWVDRMIDLAVKAKET